MIALFSATSFGQHVFTGPQVFTGSLTLQGTTIITGVLTASVVTTTGALTSTGTFSYSGAQVIGGSETASTHAYTLLGTVPLCKITTTKQDTITFKSTNYTTGQVFRFLTTSSTNDSTCFLPTAGNIMGGAYYWFTGAAGTYKTTSVFYDGTNYYILK